MPDIVVVCLFVFFDSQKFIFFLCPFSSVCLFYHGLLRKKFDYLVHNCVDVLEKCIAVAYCGLLVETHPLVALTLLASSD